MATKKKLVRKKNSSKQTIAKGVPPIRIIIEVVMRCDASVVQHPFSRTMRDRHFFTLEAGGYKPEDVIRIVLDVAGRYSTPVTAPKIRERELIANLEYTDDLFDILNIEIDKYVKSIKPDTGVTEDEITDCEKVGDVVDLVETKIKN